MVPAIFHTYAAICPFKDLPSVIQAELDVHLSSGLNGAGWAFSEVLAAVIAHFLIDFSIRFQRCIGDHGVQMDSASVALGYEAGVVADPSPASELYSPLVFHVPLVMAGIRLKTPSLQVRRYVISEFPQFPVVKLHQPVIFLARSSIYR